MDQKTIFLIFFVASLSTLGFLNSFETDNLSDADLSCGFTPHFQKYLNDNGNYDLN